METPADGMPDPRLPGYVIGRCLGRGSSGQVWEAVGDDGRRVAVKVVDPVQGLEAGLREAAVLERVAHEHVVRLLETRRLDDGRLALVTELADGGTLASVVAGRGHLTPGEVVTALSPLARTLGELHQGGIVHGDVSAGNVLFHADGKPLLGDLGVSRIAGEVRSEVWGTGGYVAPEVLDGMRPQPAADVYGIGAVAWFCLTGAAPVPTPLRQPLAELVPGLPDRMVAVVSACLSGRPERRPSAAEVARELFESVPPEPVALALGSDPAAGLTHRIRQHAADERRRAPTHRRVRWWHRGAVRLGAALLGVVVVCGGLGAGARVAWEQWGHPWLGHGHAAVRAAGSGGPHHGGGTVPAPTGSPDPPSSTTSSTASSASRSSASASSRPSTSSGRPGSTPSGRPRPGPSAPAPEPGLRSREALRVAPGRVLQELADVRARAWRRDSVPLLEQAAAEGSAALRRDRADLEEAAQLGVHYTGLRFTVRSAAVLGAAIGDHSDEVRVRARVERSAYRLVGESGPGRATARASQAVEFRLRWLGPRHGWRLVDWRPAA